MKIENESISYGGGYRIASTPAGWIVFYSGIKVGHGNNEEEAKQVIRDDSKKRFFGRPHEPIANISFANGQAKAAQEIQNKMRAVGVRVENAPMDKLKRALAKTPADDEAAGYRDRIAGFYDKWYRYNRSDDGAAYDRGCQKAIASGKCPDHFQLIEGYKAK